MEKSHNNNATDSTQTEPLTTEVKKHAEAILREKGQSSAAIPNDKDIIVRLEEEKNALKDQLIRTVADAENQRKRLEKQIKEAGDYAISKFAQNLLEVFENLHRAIEAVNQNELDQVVGYKVLFDGVDMTKRTFSSVFERAGIVRVTPQKGDPFDHNQHQAVASIPDDSIPSNCVAQVAQAGFMLHDRLLRPAMVVISTQPVVSAPSGQDPAPIVDDSSK
jgi:molecular chaperone GrpE